MTTPKTTKNLSHIDSLSKTTITTESGTTFFSTPENFFLSNVFSQYGPGDNRRETDGTAGTGTASKLLWVSTDLSNSTTCQRGGPEKLS